MLELIRKQRVLSGLLAAGLMIVVCAYLLYAKPWSRSTPLQKPLVTLRDGVFYISPDDYSETVQHLTKQSAVFLPAPQPDLELVSSDKASRDYLGPESCRECHASYVESAESTAHFRTCRLANATSIPGAFEAGRNKLSTGNLEMYYEMTHADDRYYQSLIVERRGERYVHAMPVDIVTGSAKYGQSFLYWQNQCLYELPVSHFTDVNQWVNSPGYIDGVANFARPISSRCMECHNTWFEQQSTPFNRFMSEGAILGVTCEKCHGPGREHVEHHRSIPSDRQPKHITNPASLSRDRSMDMCSLCHSGVGKPIRDSFSFRPGDRLIDFIRIPPDTDSGPGGVHSANQQARLALSHCFQESSEMQCTTCHNPHQQERGNAKLFIDRCLKCHETVDCAVVEEIGTAAEEHCIDCHMPRRADSMMPMQIKEETFRPMLRDHRIAVWNDVSEDVLRKIAPGKQLPQHKKSPPSTTKGDEQ